MKKRVADIVVEVLVENGIKDCFMVVGGGAMHLNNAFAMNKNINKIFNHHEQASAMAGEAYARACGKPAVVCVTSGPGALNTLTGVEGAWVDSIPMLVISGQTRYETSVEITGLPLRTRGVQEFEITNSVKNMTKYARKIVNPLEIKAELQKAIKLAISGRKGPVWIDIPLDIQSYLVLEDNLIPAEKSYDNLIKPDKKDMADIMQLLRNSKKPCILTGSGIRSSNTVEQFRKVAARLGVPVLGGALQADILYRGFPNYYGMTGNIGPRAGNFILQNSDLILALGNSLSFKQTGFNQEGFASNAKIIMVDIDEFEHLKPGLSIFKFIHSDLKTFFDELYDTEIKVRPEWIDYCKEVYSHFPDCEYRSNDDAGVSCYEFWDKFSELESQDSIVALGNSSCVVGRLQQGVRYPMQRVLVNYNCGSMGDDLPEAIGAYIALKKRVTCITGDGSIMMNLQELQTIVHNKMPISIVVFSNEGYGAIRQTNKNFFDGLYIGCDKNSGISFPDFEKIASAFLIPYKKCEKSTELEDAIMWLNSQGGCSFLEIIQKIDDPIIPKVMSRMRTDKTFETPVLHDMYPFIDDSEMKKYIIKGNGENIL